MASGVGILLVEANDWIKGVKSLASSHATPTYALLLLH